MYGQAVRQRQRKRQRQRQTETDRDSQTDRDRDTQTNKQTDRHTDRQTHRRTDTQIHSTQKHTRRHRESLGDLGRVKIYTDKNLPRKSWLRATSQHQFALQGAACMSASLPVRSPIPWPRLSSLSTICDKFPLFLIV